MHILLDDFHQGVKYSAQIAIHQAKLRREGNFTDQKYLSISSLKIVYLHINRKTCYDKNSERENRVQKKCTFCGVANHSAENVSKGSERKSKNLMRLLIQKTDVRISCLKNVLDADLNII